MKLLNTHARLSTMSRLVVASALGMIAAAPRPALAKEVCIYAQDIDHTSIPDDHTIIFYMRGHKAWKNALVGDCATLKMSTRGFTYSPTDPGSDQICSNLQTIRVNDTGETCLLGEFTPYDPTTQSAAPR
jgi:hypothetical protein